MLMKLGRDHVMVTPSGISIGFLAETPTHVPNRFVREAIAIGAVAVDNQERVDAVKAEMEAQRAAAEGRSKRIEDGVRAMIERNQRGDFTGAGRPNLRILNRMTDLEITAEELEPIYEKIKLELQTQ